MRRLRLFPFSTLLFSVFPVFSLLAHNIDQIRVVDVSRALIVALLGSGILVLIYKRILKDWQKADLAGSLSILLFSSYGHIYRLLKGVHLFNSLLGRHRYLLPVWLILFAFGLYWIQKRLQDPTKVITSIRVVAIIAILMPTVDILSFKVRFHHTQPKMQETDHEECEITLPSDGQTPDIYYIILDAYAREDTLKDIHQYDNSSFIAYLKQKGFFIANWSQSNYAYTMLSLSSSLNMNYLQDLDERIFKGAPFDRTPLYPLLKEPIVRQNLECLGYKVVTLESGYMTGWVDADIYLSLDSSSFETFEVARGINAVESMLIRNSLSIVLFDFATVLPKFLQVDTNNPFQEHYDRLIYLFDALEQIVPTIEGPKFVFAHILATHWPYVFGPNGEPIRGEGQFTLIDTDSENETKQKTARYQDQITYVNLRLVHIIDEILLASETPPIIILQSDHGPSDIDNKLNIMNAYHLPQCDDQLLYHTISPVNSFRAVFNCAFDSNYDFIGDRSYYSSYESFDFRLVSNPHAEE